MPLLRSAPSISQSLVSTELFQSSVESLECLHTSTSGCINLREVQIKLSFISIELQRQFAQLCGLVPIAFGASYR
jgi:hypothetical protein